MGGENSLPAKCAKFCDVDNFGNLRNFAKFAKFCACWSAPCNTLFLHVRLFFPLMIDIPAEEDALNELVAAPDGDGCGTSGTPHISGFIEAKMPPVHCLCLLRVGWKGIFVQNSMLRNFEKFCEILRNFVTRNQHPPFANPPPPAIGPPRGPPRGQHNTTQHCSLLILVVHWSRQTGQAHK